MFVMFLNVYSLYMLSFCVVSLVKQVNLEQGDLKEGFKKQFYTVIIMAYVVVVRSLSDFIVSLFHFCFIFLPFQDNAESPDNE